jgi:chemotaxis protein MotB
VSDDNEIEEDVPREEWDETIAAVKAEADVRGEKTYLSRARQQAASGDRRALSHLWLVSYSDFMTILMIFFLAMYGYTVLAKATLYKNKPVQMTNSEFAQAVGQLKGSLGDNIQVKEDSNRVTVRLADHVLFASGQAELTKNALSSLAEIGKSLTLVKGEIVVEGHTDNVPVRVGRYRSNWELSVARSFHVIEALSKSGVPAERMAAWGFGENRPLASNLDAQGRASNRRIEIVLINKGEK